MKSKRGLFSDILRQKTKKLLVVSSLAFFLALFAAVPAGAAVIEQWASTVIGFSSEWSPVNNSASQATGAPNVIAYGDSAGAWATAHQNGTLEYITLGYATPVYATGAVIRETYGNGMVYRVDVLDQSDVLHTVWSGTDPSLPGSPVDFAVNWPQTTYLVKGLKIYINTDHTTGWEEIDAVQLLGSASLTVNQQWASTVIGFSSEWSPVNNSASQATGTPNVIAYGDSAGAWCSAHQNGTLEYITLGYSTPVYASGAIIRETLGNGLVYQVDVLDQSDVLHTVWTGTDPSQPGTPVDFQVNWPTTTYLVKGLKIYINTDHTTGWEEIDAVALLSASEPSNRVKWSGPGANNHWYEAVYVPEGITWSAAKAAATARKGYLATATSAAENTFIYGLVSDPKFWFVDYVGNSCGPWLGGYQTQPAVEPAGSWRWVTAETWSFTNWASGEPTNYGGTEYCLQFFTNTNNSVLTPGETWNDNSDINTVKGYIIEWSESSSGMPFLLLLD